MCNYFSPPAYKLKSADCVSASKWTTNNSTEVDYWELVLYKNWFLIPVLPLKEKIF